MTAAAPHQAIYRRWRAQTFGQIVGQEAVVTTLQNAVRAERVSHAILFVGPRGTGKTSLARILAKALNCTNLQDGDPCDRCEACVSIRDGTALDVVEIDAASNRGINEVRELRDRLQYAPSSLRRKVYILDEAHQITRDAWNALLKSLEEPPDFVVFMFASTHPQDFPPAVLSRLQRYDVRRLTTAEIEGKLTRILAADGRSAEPTAINLIARLAAGGMRDAEAMLDQLLSSAQYGLDERAVRDLLGLAGAEAVDGFIEALVAGDPAAGIGILDGLEDRGRDLRGFLDQVVDATRAALVAEVAKVGSGAWPRAGLLTAARRLAQIDPSRAGATGLRLQLELALFGAEEAPTAPGSLAASAAPAVPGGVRASAVPAAPIPGRRPSAAPARTSAVPVEPLTPHVEPRPEAQPRDESREASVAPAPEALSLGEEPPEPPEPPTAMTSSGRSAEPSAPVEVVSSPPRPADPEFESGPSSDTATTDELARLRELWPLIVTHISAHPPTRPLIVACRPIAVEGNIVTLGFPEDQAFLKEVAVRRRPNLESGITHFLGHPVNVRCVATNLDVSPVADDTQAAYLLGEARRIFADDLVDPGEVG